jgi:hypothetical protein
MAKGKKMNYSAIENAQNAMMAAGRSGSVETSTFHLHDTIKLATGEDSNFYPFSQSRADAGKTLAESNVQQGGKVPANQEWEVHALGVQVIAPTPLAPAGLAALGDYLANSSVQFKIDSDTKLESTLSEILGSAVLVQGDDTTGSNALNATFTGKLKFDVKRVMGAQTQYEYIVINGKDKTVPAALDGVQIRLTQYRTLKIIKG